ncbi:MAG TPA: acyl-CoA dehydrogenase family protein [Dehalococcoidia bacterium]|nr:acyl-CoA dehydrogenase family protein [Dehalococcoidia bacterium]
MEFRFSPEDEAFRAEVRQFLEAELPRRAPDRIDGWEFHRQFVRKLADRGWLTLGWPQEWGGQGAGHLRQLVFNEEMAQADAPANDLGSDRVGPTIILHGTDEQKRRFLPAIVRGEAVWCQGFSEPEAGSDLASLQTRAVLDGDSFIINGSKIWTSLAHYAQWMILLARTDPEAPKHRGISYFLVDMKTPGITIAPLTDMAGRHTFNQVFFENARIPRDALLGELNRGWYVATSTLDFERSGIQRVIGSMRTYRDLVDYARDLVRGGRLPSAYESVRMRLADLQIAFEVGRMLAYRVAWLQSRGQVPNYEASVSKMYGSELAQQLARTGMQLLGPAGQLAPGSPWAPLAGRIESLYLQSAALTIAAGTSEINRGIIATRGLELPRA